MVLTAVTPLDRTTSKGLSNELRTAATAAAAVRRTAAGLRRSAAQELRDGSHRPGARHHRRHPLLWGCFIFSIGGVILGLLGKKDVRESNGAKKGENLAQWAFILGLVGIALGIVYWILVGTEVIDLSYDSSFGN